MLDLKNKNNKGSKTGVRTSSKNNRQVINLGALSNMLTAPVLFNRDNCLKVDTVTGLSGHVANALCALNKNRFNLVIIP